MNFSMNLYSKASRNLRYQKFLHNKQKKGIRRCHKRKRRRIRHRAEYTSKVLRCLQQAQFSLPIKGASGQISVNIPETFCFSRAPEETILFLRKLYTYATNLHINRIHFNHLHCKTMGVCASTAMDVILMQCQKWRRSIKQPIHYSGILCSSGKVSLDPETDTLLKASGILRHLGVSHGKFDEIECLELIKDEESSIIAEKIIDYIQRALLRHHLMLTPTGSNYLGQLLGEIADNCHQHGGKNATWYTLGHYALDKKNQMGKCKLVIMDFGNTIYDGLKYTAPPDMQRKIRHYTHRAWKIFQEKEETLFTLFSLQQRVSRFEQENRTRGNGTIVFLDAFQKLFKSNTQSFKSLLSITSGKCSILFDGTYLLKEEIFENGYKNKIIAFNRENKLNRPPDKNFVRTLKNSFPGTVISMELYIDESLIARKES